MAYSYKKSRHLPAYPKNPFMEDVTQVVSDKKEHRKAWLKQTDERGEGVSQMIVNTNTGEALGTSAFYTIKTVDTLSFTKVYNDTIHYFFNLDKAGIRVFAYILSIIKPNIDMFYLDYVEAKQFTHYNNDRSISEGIVQLIKADLIAKSSKGKHWYYINPMAFFNGDRIQLVVEYRKSQLNESTASDRELLENKKSLPERLSLDTKLTSIEDDMLTNYRQLVKRAEKRLLTKPVHEEKVRNKRIKHLSNGNDGKEKI